MERRDLAQLESGLKQWWRRQHGTAPDGFACRHATAGLSNETVIVSINERDEVVVRLAPQVPSFPSYDLGAQASIQNWVAGHGVSAPSPCEVVEDPSFVGVPFLVMPFISGQIPGQASAFDPWFTEASASEQHDAFSAVVDLLVTIGSLPVPQPAEVANLRRGSVADEILWWGTYLEWAANGQVLPALSECLDALSASAPSAPIPLSLCWGDARLGNCVYQDRRVVGVLDWEMALIGPAELDLSWFLALEDMMSRLLRRRIEGFPSRQETIASYERGLGRPLMAFEWFEQFALFRAVAVNYRQALSAQAAGVAHPTKPDNSDPMLAMLRADLGLLSLRAG